MWNFRNKFHLPVKRLYSNNKVIPIWISGVACVMQGVIRTNFTKMVFWVKMTVVWRCSDHRLQFETFQIKFIQREKGFESWWDHSDVIIVWIVCNGRRHTNYFHGSRLFSLIVECLSQFRPVLPAPFRKFPGDFGQEVIFRVKKKFKRPISHFSSQKKF